MDSMAAVNQSITASEPATPPPVATNKQPPDASTHRHRPSRHTVDVSPDAPRLHGLIVSRQDKYGFIKSVETDQRYFFHMRDTDGVATHGAQVTFVVAHDRTADKDIAFDVQTVSERPRSANANASHHHHPHHHNNNHGNKHGNNNNTPKEERLPGECTGIVASVPRGPANVNIDDGMIVFTDPSGTQQQALFGVWRLKAVPGSNHPTIPGLGDPVTFGVVRNPGTGVYKATNVRLCPTMMAAAAAAAAATGGGKGTGKHNNTPAPTSNETALDLAISAIMDTPTSASLSLPPPPPGPQLGRVALLKKEFGFIRQVSRPGDLFFHFSQLEDGLTAGEVVVGDDVEFTVHRDGTGKMSAQSVRRAAPGSVVFDEVSETVFEGVVLEKPVVTKQYVQSSGVVEYALEQGGGSDGSDDGSNDDGVQEKQQQKKQKQPKQKQQQEQKRRLVFAAGDCVGGVNALRPGDHVYFKIATNIAAAAAAAHASMPGVAELAGRRAIEVAPLVCSGVVAAVYLDRKFGFLMSSPSVALDSSSGSGNKEGEGGKEVINDSDATQAQTPLPPSLSSSATSVGAKESEIEPHNDGDGDDDTESALSVATTTTTAATTNAVESTVTTTTTTTPVPVPAPTHPPHHHKRRVFFHFSEVIGGISLKVGDEVAFVLHSNLKNGEVNAARIRRTKAAPQPPPQAQQAQGHQKKDKSTSTASTTTTKTEGALYNPHKLKLTGNLQSGEHKTQYKPKMPDGTKGFVYERTKGLDEAAAAVTAAGPSASPLMFFAGLPLKGLGRAEFIPSLSVEAKPFVPRSESSASLKGM